MASRERSWVFCMAGKTMTSAPLSVNKHFFKEYLTSFAEGKEALALKKAEKEGKQTLPGPSLQSPLPPKSSAAAALLFNRKTLSPEIIAKRLKKKPRSLGEIQPDVNYSQGKKKIFSFY